MMQKYFIAIVPPEPITSDICAIKTHVSKTYNSHGALQSPAHITLHMPFTWEETKEEKLLKCLQEFKNDTDLNIRLKNYNCFEPRVVFMDVEKNESLFNFQKKLVFHVKQNLQLFNQYEDLRGFHPHITIAFRDLKKQIFYKVWDEFKEKEYKAEFVCNSFSLFKKGKVNWEVYKNFEL